MEVAISIFLESDNLSNDYFSGERRYEMIKNIEEYLEKTFEGMGIAFQF